MIQFKHDNMHIWNYLSSKHLLSHILRRDGDGEKDSHLFAAKDRPIDKQRIISRDQKAEGL